MVTFYDAPPSSLIHSTTSPKVETTEGEGVGAHSLTYSTLGVKGHPQLGSRFCLHARAPRWD